MNKLNDLEMNFTVVSELGVAVKELLASEHYDAAGLLTQRLINYTEKCGKLLQGLKEELNTPVVENKDGAPASEPKTETQV